MTNLAKLLKLHMAANDIDTKTMAETIGVPAQTLSRFIAGKNVEAVSLMGIFNWLAQEAK